MESDEEEYEKLIRESSASDLESEESVSSYDEDEYRCSECGYPTPPQDDCAKINWVQCEGGCSKWYHTVCVSVGILDASTSWECDRCLLEHELSMS